MRERDRQIIDHVHRHRITTNEVLHKLFFTDQQHNAVTKVTARLCRAEFLRKFPLYHPRTYFTLGPQAARQLGAPLQRTLPLGPQSLPTEYAALVYASGKPHLRRLTTQELEQLVPWLYGPFADFPYCWDESTDPTVLELLRVDLGGRPDYVARKCEADMEVRRPLSGFEEWIRHGRFRLVVITGTTEKAALIRSAIEGHVWPDGLSIRLVVVSDLLHLTARISDGP